MSDKTLLMGLCFCGLLIIALFTLNGGIALLALPFLLYLGLGIWLSPSLETISLSAERVVRKTIGDGVANVEVELILTNHGPETVCLLVNDIPQGGMKIVKGTCYQRFLLEPGQEERHTYTFETRRGHFSWKNIETRVGDPLRVIETRLNLPAAAEIQVQPQLKKFKPFQLRPNSTLHSPGSIPARQGGSGTNFWGVREYQPGDSQRWLEWRLTARHPGKLFTKEFEQEEIAEIGLVLDARRRAEIKVNNESLFECGVNAVASLAEMFIRQGHRVSLLVYQDNPVRAYPDYGKLQLRRILNCLSQASTDSGNGSLNYLENLPVRLLPSHALLLMVSPLTNNDWQLFPRLKSQGYQVVLVSPDPVHFANRNMVIKKDNTRMALRAANIERQLIIRNILRLEIPVIDWKVDQPLSPLVKHALTRPVLSRRGW